MVGHEGAGIFAGNEIQASSDPHQHAVNTVNNMVANNFKWLALEIGANSEATCAMVKSVCESNGKVRYGLWDQNVAGSDALIAIDRRSPYFYIVNNEGPSEDARWTDAHLDAMVARKLPGGLALIFTEGAMGRDKAKSARWRSRGFFAIPEAVLNANGNATIPAMLELAQALGWAGIDTGPCVYFDNDFPSSAYSSTIGQTMGRFSCYRLGDIGDNDWTTMKQWPRVVSYTPPSTTPARTTTVILGEISDLADEIQAGFAPGTGALSRATIIERIADSTDAEWNAARSACKTALDLAGA